MSKKHLISIFDELVAEIRAESAEKIKELEETISKMEITRENIEIPNDSELSEFEIDNFLPSRHEVQQYLDAEDYLDENGILVDGPTTCEEWFNLACEYMIKKHIRPLLKEIVTLKSKNDNKGERNEI